MPQVLRTRLSALVALCVLCAATHAEEHCAGASAGKVAGCASEESVLLQRHGTAKAVAGSEAPLAATGKKAGLASNTSTASVWFADFDKMAANRTDTVEPAPETAYDSTPAMPAPAVPPIGISSAAAGYRPEQIIAARDEVSQLLFFAVFSIFVQVSFVTMAAFCYQECVMTVLPEVDPAKRGTDFTRWTSSLFWGLGSHRAICLSSICCPCIRWADNQQKLGIMSFWPAVVLSTCSLLMLELTYGLFLILIVMGMLYFRQRLRRKFKMERSSCSWLSDLLALMICLPCAIAQDSRQVEDACAAGDSAVVPHWAV